MLNKIIKIRCAIRRSKNSKKLIENFGFLMMLQIASYIFPLITIPYLAHTIGVDGFGKIAFAAAVVMWFQTITDWGFNYTATRDVSRNRHDIDKVSEIFSNVFWSKVCLMIFSLMLLILCICFIPYFYSNKMILLTTFLIIPGQILFTDWFFQAMEEMKYITFLSLTSKLLFTVLIFVFITKESDFIIQPMLVASGYIVSGFFSMYLVVFKWNVKINLPTLLSISKTLSSSKDVFINNFLPNLYNSFSTVLLGFFSGSVANGLFDAGSKILNICNQFMMVFSRVFFPFLSRRLDRHSTYTLISLSLSIAGSVLLFFGAPLVVTVLFTPEFYQAVLVLKILAFSLIFLSLNNIYGTNYLIIKGFERELRNITFIASVIGFIISFPLIYYYDYIGAAVTITFTRAILGGSVAYKAYNIRTSGAHT